MVDLCRRLNPSDYVTSAWPSWTREASGLNLVAERDGRVVGCLHVGLEIDGQTFGQAMRIDCDHRRAAIGTRLMRSMFEHLRSRGLLRMLGVTGVDNLAARAFYASLGFREMLEVQRRHHPAWRGSGGGVESHACTEPLGAGRLAGMLVSRPGVAHYRRIYFRAPAAWMEEAARARRLRAFTRPGGLTSSVVVIDSPDPQGEGLWVAALDGLHAPDRLLELLPAGQRPAPVTIDAPADPEVQQALTVAGFAPAEASLRYVVLEVEFAASA